LPQSEKCLSSNEFQTYNATIIGNVQNAGRRWLRDATVLPPEKGAARMMQFLLHDLARSDEHLANNERNIAEQVRRIESMEAGGYDTSASKALLCTFKDLRRSYLTRRKALLREMVALTRV
jgi:hypothetical protein